MSSKNTSTSTSTSILLSTALLFSSVTYAAVPSAPSMSILVDDQTVTVDWTSTEEATGYKLHYALAPYAGPQTIAVIDLGTQLSLATVLPLGSSYYVAITAYNGEGESGYSNIDLFTISDSVWIINTTGERSEHIIDSTTGLGVKVDVQSVSEVTVDTKKFVVVNSLGIPKYDVTVTQTILDDLNNRPRASNDFITGVTTARVGDVLSFGEDIGYRSNSNCTAYYGYGYWPPGPECPTEDERTIYLPLEPVPTTIACDNSLSKIGVMVNGSSIYNWGDGFTYTSDGYWSNLAPVAEVYDVDVCGGHAAGTDYHHHFYSSCLAEIIGDDGTKHSPIFGYAADGYPIYGPWQENGVYAKSSWVTRNYDDSIVGCDDGARSCVLNDQYDVSQGTTVVTSGPAFDETIISASQNEFIAKNGFYFEDYYWDSSLNVNYLDQYNGHSDDERGYHYHITVAAAEDGSISPVFPYIIGPRYAGELQDNAVASCNAGGGLPVGDPTGPPVGDPPGPPVGSAGPRL